MSENEIAISVAGVSRMYKRYRSPRYRIMEAFNLPLPKTAYDEFWALRDISLEVKRGESLGLIGQNGAGKSTLLSIVCGRLKPTSGTVAVRGNIQALMDMGTGFHPEFTGRENIFASLAYRGVIGRAANELYDEIVEFSELDEFIEHPVKTYSTGMYARLAFSTATAITPDVLIIDEILGAGDAYFAGKCAARMHRLTKETGATVLFVSHDISSVQRLCEHAIWIDRGRIRMAGTSLDISKSYYADVLAREEARLQAETGRAVARMRRRDGVGNSSEAQGTPLLFRLVTADGQPPRNSHPIRRVALVTGDGRRLEIGIGGPMDDDEAQAAYIGTDPEYMLWGLAETIDGATARCFEDTGGAYRHAPIFFQGSADVAADAKAIEIEHSVRPGDNIAVEIHESGGYRRLGFLTSHTFGSPWRTEIFPIAEAAIDAAAVEEAKAPEGIDAAAAQECASSPDLAQVKPLDRWESPEARFLDIVACNVSDMAPRHTFGLGETIAFKIVVEMRVSVPVCWLAGIVFDQLGNRVCLGVHKFDSGLQSGKNEILFQFAQPNLRQGEYVGSFELLPVFDYEWPHAYRIPVLCHWDRCIYFKIDEGYRGTVHLGLVSLPIVVTDRPLVEPHLQQRMSLSGNLQDTASKSLGAGSTERRDG